MGQPKAWLPFGDELMLPRIVRILGQTVGPIIVVAAPEQQLPPLPDQIAVVRDRVKGQGPLRGLAAGLSTLKEACDAVYASSCDVPLLQPAFVRRMVELLGANSIAVPRAGGRLHPLAAVYRVQVLPTIEELLASNQLRTTSLFGLLPTRIVTELELTEVDPSLASLRNLNTPEELQSALETYSNSIGTPHDRDR